MSFKGYKLKAKLYAAHSNIAGNVENTHFHTFTIVLYLKDLNEDMDFFFYMEKEITEWLAPYQNKELSNTELFRGKSTTLEAIGDTFYDEWVERAKALNFELIRLDIYENPIRTYSVSDKMLDADVNEISAMPYAFTDTIKHGEEDGYIQEAAATVLEEAGRSHCEAGAVTEAEADAPEKDREENGTEEKKERKKGRKSAGGRSFLLALKLIGALLLFGAVAATILYSMMIGGNYPQGSDTLCHLYRADVLLSSIKEGVFYPLYDKMWYNGVEIMRYWAPIPLYILAALEAAAGSVLGGYLLFVASVFLIGAIGWLLLGVKLNRIGLSVFVGIIWFFCRRICD